MCRKHKKPHTSKRRVRGFQLSYSFCAVGLEAVVDTEYEVVGIEVETETVAVVGVVSAVLVVSIAVAEEAAVSHVAVSYTNLTLPPNREVEDKGGSGTITKKT